MESIKLYKKYMNLSLSQIMVDLMHYKYIILFPLAVIEGPLVSFAAGFLVRTGVLNLWLTYLILLPADLIPDTMFYAIGYYGLNSKLVQNFIGRFSFFHNHFDRVEKLWKNHAWKTILLGKIAYGMALPFLMSAGMVKMPFKKFLWYTFQVTMLQYTIILAIGYASGHFYAMISRYIYVPYYFMGAVVIIFIVSYILVSKLARREITGENNGK